MWWAASSYVFYFFVILVSSFFVVIVLQVTFGHRWYRCHVMFIKSCYHNSSGIDSGGSLLDRDLWSTGLLGELITVASHVAILSVPEEAAAALG